MLASACGRIGFEGTSSDAASDAPPSGRITLGATADTTLRQAQPTTSYGADDSLGASPSSTTLILVDVPVGTRVLAAELHIATEDVGLASGSAEVYAVHETWTESAATYVQRTATTSWTDPGCGAPVSRAAATIATFSPTAASTRYVVALPASVVQSWADAPAANAGLAIAIPAGGGTVTFLSREDSPTAGPFLVITTP